MHVIKSVGVLSVAKLTGLVQGCLGLIVAPIFLLVGLLGSLAGSDKTPFAGIVGVIFAILIPIFYGVIGFIFGAIGALLYNLFAKLVGGFELEMEFRPIAPAAPYPIVPPATPGIQSGGV